ncbi:hypothetical protein M5K25_026645 [Dendrobium thyrsiflorum]|uniref:DUF4283 domain-containing protein n=1 Tax=Dendrobium thyrsiflorum TaxID=117978 RepID=A0ABD0TXQ6_DENTH
MFDISVESPIVSAWISFRDLRPHLFSHRHTKSECYHLYPHKRKHNPSKTISNVNDNAALAKADTPLMTINVENPSPIMAADIVMEANTLPNSCHKEKYEGIDLMVVIPTIDAKSNDDQANQNSYDFHVVTTGMTTKPFLGHVASQLEDLGPDLQ